MRSPNASPLVGSPTTQASGVSPRPAIQPRSLTVPQMAGPSSSPVTISVTVPGMGPRASRRATAATKAATPDFMSTLPRPCSAPSATSPENGSRAHPSPGGTTSTCPAKARWGAVMSGLPPASPAQDRVQVRHVGRAGGGEGGALDLEAERAQRRFQHIERGASVRRDGGRAHEGGGERDRVGGVELRRVETRGVKGRGVGAHAASAPCPDRRASAASTSGARVARSIVPPPSTRTRGPPSGAS